MFKRSKKILVVEDDPVLRRVVVDLLSADGFKVIAAKNGQEGLALAVQEHPDLIALDLMLPVMDGMSVLKELRKDEWGAKVRVVIMSNLTISADLKTEAESLHAADAIEKANTSIDDVVKRIKAAL